MPSEAPAPAPRSRSTVVVDFVRNLLVGDTIPTVKVIIATLVLFVVRSVVGRKPEADRLGDHRRVAGSHHACQYAETGLRPCRATNNLPPEICRHYSHVRRDFVVKTKSEFGLRKLDTAAMELVAILDEMVQAARARSRSYGEPSRKSRMKSRTYAKQSSRNPTVLRSSLRSTERQPVGAFGLPTLLA